MDVIDMNAYLREQLGADMDTVSDEYIGRVIQEGQLAKVQQILDDPKKLATFGKSFRDAMRSPKTVAAMLGAIESMKLTDKPSS